MVQQIPRQLSVLVAIVSILIAHIAIVVVIYKSTHFPATIVLICLMSLLTPILVALICFLWVKHFPSPLHRYQNMQQRCNKMTSPIWITMMCYAIMFYAPLYAKDVAQLAHVKTVPRQTNVTVSELQHVLHNVTVVGMNSAFVHIDNTRYGAAMTQSGAFWVRRIDDDSGDYFFGGAGQLEIVVPEMDGNYWVTQPSKDDVDSLFIAIDDFISKYNTSLSVPVNASVIVVQSDWYHDLEAAQGDVMFGSQFILYTLVAASVLIFLWLVCERA